MGKKRSKDKDLSFGDFMLYFVFGGLGLVVIIIILEHVIKWLTDWGWTLVLGAAVIAIVALIIYIWRRNHRFS